MNVSLFFTRGQSLRSWVESGLFDREKIIYEELLNSNSVGIVFWLTYGDDDYSLASKLKASSKLHPRIKIIQMPRFFSSLFFGVWLYSFLMPLVCFKAILKSDVLKTNQMDGAWAAIISKLLYRKKIYIRTGYTLSQLEMKLNPERNIRNRLIELLELTAYRVADASSVSSLHNREYLIDKYQLAFSSINVLNNYIDVKRFYPFDKNRTVFQFLYVGRLNKEKNIFNLLDAVKAVNGRLDIYGKGPLESDLKKHVELHSINVNFCGVVANSELPNIYNQYPFYILPSLYEGMPKTLLEAMACGCVCIGTDVEGVNEVIVNNVNGYLSKDTSVDSIVKTLRVAINAQNKDLIGAGVTTIHKNFSLNAVVQLEEKILHTLCLC